MSFVRRGLTMRGVRAFDHLQERPVWLTEFARALQDGTMTFPHTRFTGIEQAPRALCELVEGRHLGAVLVEL
jgi:NADPH-dependent curcumin reductase CurA